LKILQLNTINVFPRCSDYAVRFVYIRPYSLNSPIVYSLPCSLQPNCLNSSFFEHYNRVSLCDWVLGHCSVC